MSILVLTSDTLIGTPATGNIEYNGQFFGTDSNASRAQLQRIVQETDQATTSGTSKDFTGIPAWVKKITVMFSGVSTNGTSNLLVQIGDSGGIETTAYQSGIGSIVTTSAATASSTAGYLIGGASASNQAIGHYTFTNVTGNSWVGSGVIYLSNSQVIYAAGAKTLSGTLDRVRITTVNGTDTFDSGSINIMYEG
jgi:hypothetical protein